MLARQWSSSVDHVADIEWDPELYKWEHVANVLRERIRTGVYPPGTLLSEVQLMTEFDVARGTIRQAMRVLKDESLIITKRGKGSIVRGRVAGGDVLA